MLGGFWSNLGGRRWWLGLGGSSGGGENVGIVDVFWRRRNRIDYFFGCGVWAKERGIKEDFRVFGLGILKDGVDMNWSGRL